MSRDSLSYWWRTRVSPEAKLLVLFTLVLLGVNVYLVAGRAGASEPLPPVSRAPARIATEQALQDVGLELRDARLFELWTLSNPGELERYELYAEAVGRGLRREPPEMLTPLGRALVAALAAATRAG